MDKRNIATRKFRTEDAEAVSNIIRNNLLNVNSRDYSEEVIKSAYEKFTPKYILTLSNKKKMYVAVDDRTVIGTAAIDFDTISNVFVEAQFHSKGIDKALISLLEEIAANNGIKHIKIVATLTVQKRYEKLGYEIVEEVQSDEFGKEILMERFLD